MLLAKVRIINEDRRGKNPYKQYYNHSSRSDTSGFKPFETKLIHRATRVGSDVRPSGGMIVDFFLSIIINDVQELEGST